MGPAGAALHARPRAPPRHPPPRRPRAPGAAVSGGRGGGAGSGAAPLRARRPAARHGEHGLPQPACAVRARLHQDAGLVVRGGGGGALAEARRPARARGHRRLPHGGRVALLPPDPRPAPAPQVARAQQLRQLRAAPARARQAQGLLAGGPAAERDADGKRQVPPVRGRGGGDEGDGDAAGVHVLQHAGARAAGVHHGAGARAVAAAARPGDHQLHAGLPRAARDGAEAHLQGLPRGRRLGVRAAAGHVAAVRSGPARPPGPPRRRRPHALNGALPVAHGDATSTLATCQPRRRRRKTDNVSLTWYEQSMMQTNRVTTTPCRRPVTT